mmetsp:Transcript_17112/g.12236  ORF Transcript_17112/g.12236 Transcript_17112/m.12236 type:complete len:81 (-) Transcript_17112:126-368(-)
MHLESPTLATTNLSGRIIKVTAVVPEHFESKEFVFLIFSLHFSYDCSSKSRIEASFNDSKAKEAAGAVPFVENSCDMPFH